MCNDVKVHRKLKIVDRLADGRRVFLDDEGKISFEKKNINARISKPESSLVRNLRKIVAEGENQKA